MAIKSIEDKCIKDISERLLEANRYRESPGAMGDDVAPCRVGGIARRRPVWLGGCGFGPIAETFQR
ncbi:hypothetical protein ACLIIZ_21010, partial [Azonexus caeni]|uniref:hypothetical protein n=1 Tax=Azonexus caeni TaxID=266126 RepID=UPI003A8C1498